VGRRLGGDRALKPESTGDTGHHHLCGWPRRPRRWQPNNNCAPDKLVETTAEFGRTARIPTLWIYAENDTFFGPDLSKRMHEAYAGAGGNAEYHLLPAFGGDGHFLIGSADAIPLWAPLVSQFLDKHP
jgi:pimeloyl-ACP methyl ester carboxylesterase